MIYVLTSLCLWITLVGTTVLIVLSLIHDYRTKKKIKTEELERTIGVIGMITVASVAIAIILGVISDISPLEALLFNYKI
jgi:hypothetical protein